MALISFSAPRATFSLPSSCARAACFLCCCTAVLLLSLLCCEFVFRFFLFFYCFFFIPQQFLYPISELRVYYVGKITGRFTTLLVISTAPQTSTATLPSEFLSFLVYQGQSSCPYRALGEQICLGKNEVLPGSVWAGGGNSSSNSSSNNRGGGRKGRSLGRTPTARGCTFHVVRERQGCPGVSRMQGGQDTT